MCVVLPHQRAVARPGPMFPLLLSTGRQQQQQQQLQRLQKKQQHRQQSKLQQGMARHKQQAQMVRTLTLPTGSGVAGEEEADAPIPSLPNESGIVAVSFDKVRRERNQREQERSRRINGQIKALRALLAAGNATVGTVDNKFSVLVHVATYIQELQRRSVALDSDRTRLMATIRSTTGVLEGKETCGFCTDSERRSPLTCSSDEETGAATSTLPQTALLERPMGMFHIDCAAVFRHCPYPISLASLDGTILASNRAFEERFNPIHFQSCMTSQSLFAYVRNHQELYEALSALLEQSMPLLPNLLKVTNHHKDAPIYWQGRLQTTQNEMVGGWRTADVRRYSLSMRLTHGASLVPIHRRCPFQ
jgi:Helix-loop-helix DNA-binding domain